MIPLQQIQIKSPCLKSWAAMDGDDQKRYCEGCRKDVFNLSAMTAAAAQEVIDAHDGNLCVRFELQASGRIVTADTPRAMERRKARPALSFGWAVALIVAGIVGLPGIARSASPLKQPSPKHEKLTHLLGEPTKLPATSPKAHGTADTSKQPKSTELPALMGKPMAPPPKVPVTPKSPTMHGHATVPQNREMIGDIVMPTPITAFESLRPSHPIHK